MTEQDFDRLSTDEILDHMAAQKLRILIEFRQPLRGGPAEWVVRFGEGAIVTAPDRHRAMVLAATGMKIGESSEES